jgi:hypothetical protein
VCERAIDDGGGAFVFGVEIGVARGEREAGIFTHGWENDDLRVEGEVAHETFDDERLLRVLLAEVGEVRADDVEENRQDGGDAAKVAGTRCAFELLGEAFDFDVGGKVFRVNFFGRRGEDVVHVVIGESHRVFRQIARVAREVFLRPELFGVDEDRDDHDIAHAPRLAHEAQVAFMQRAHRRHQPDSFIQLASHLARHRVHALTAIDDFHRE